MNSKKLIRNLLLLFVAGSLAYMAVREASDRRAKTGDAPPAESYGPAVKLVVYYFSEGKECTTCERIPAFTREVLDANFAAELTSGAIEWRAIDVDEARNSHFISQYGVYTKSVVLVRVENGKQARWKNLEGVWDLVYDKDAFVAYIRTEIRTNLDAAA